MSVFEAAVYLLCLITSLVCAGLLIRSYARTREPLLFWSALCFCLLGANNFAVVADMLFLPAIDLTPLRDLISFAAVSVLVGGFIWGSE